MGYQSKTLGYQTVALSEGYSATIRKLTKAQMDEAQSHLLQDARQHSERAPGEVARIISEGKMDSSGYTSTLLLYGIHAWTLDDESGAPLPITRDTINNVLTTEDSATLIVAIDKLCAGGLDPNAGKSGSSGSS